MEEVASRFHTRTDFLYLGRGINYPIALEGALKLKEISYIHAEGTRLGDETRADCAHRRADAGGALAPKDHVFEKMIGNIRK